MTRIVTFTVGALLALTAAAQARPSTTRMTCDQAQNLVLRHGAAVMDTGPYTFERIVSSRAYCERTQFLERFYAPTRDAYQCHVGYRCIERSVRFNNGSHR